MESSCQEASAQIAAEADRDQSYATEPSWERGDPRGARSSDQARPLQCCARGTRRAAHPTASPTWVALDDPARPGQLG
jgi:hypothetical protein